MIVADTHSWVWWLTDRRLLSRPAQEALNGDVVAISPITFLEVTTLARKGRITFNRPVTEWLRQSVERSGTQIIDLTLDIAAAAGLLESNQVGDPTDRVIIATALHLRAPLVTKDHKIIASAVVPTIW